MIQVCVVFLHYGDVSIPALQTSGRDIDILSDHQQRRGSNVPPQGRLRAFAEPRYEDIALYHNQSRPSSTTASLTSSRVYYRSRESVKLTNYPPEVQEVLRAARHFASNNMVKDVGWLYGDANADLLDANFSENFYAACTKVNHGKSTLLSPSTVPHQVCSYHLQLRLRIFGKSFPQINDAVFFYL